MQPKIFFLGAIYENIQFWVKQFAYFSKICPVRGLLKFDLGNGKETFICANSDLYANACYRYYSVLGRTDPNGLDFDIFFHPKGFHWEKGLVGVGSEETVSKMVMV